MHLQSISQDPKFHLLSLSNLIHSASLKFILSSLYPFYDKYHESVRISLRLDNGFPSKCHDIPIASKDEIAPFQVSSPVDEINYTEIRHVDMSDMSQHVGMLRGQRDHQPMACSCSWIVTSIWSRFSQRLPWSPSLCLHVLLILPADPKQLRMMMAISLSDWMQRLLTSYSRFLLPQYMQISLWKVCWNIITKKDHII